MVYINHHGRKTPFIEVMQAFAREQGEELTEGCLAIFGQMEAHIEDLHSRFPALSLSEILNLIQIDENP